MNKKPKFLNERKKIDELIPYATNARTHSAAQVSQIAASIKEFGFTNPVIVDDKGNIIAGHGRVMAAKEIGLEDVPVIVVSGWSDAQKKAYVIADNKLALNAGWDDEILRSELITLDDMGFDLDLTGFDSGEVKMLLTPPLEKDEPQSDGARMVTCPACGEEFNPKGE